jgi:hypothetical protein
MKQVLAFFSEAFVPVIEFNDKETVLFLLRSVASKVKVHVLLVKVGIVIQATK